jgi:hypothetical protein
VYVRRMLECEGGELGGDGLGVADAVRLAAGSMCSEVAMALGIRGSFTDGGGVADACSVAGGQVVALAACSLTHYCERHGERSERRRDAQTWQLRAVLRRRAVRRDCVGVGVVCCGGRLEWTATGDCGAEASGMV